MRFAPRMAVVAFLLAAPAGVVGCSHDSRAPTADPPGKRAGAAEPSAGCRAGTLPQADGTSHALTVAGEERTYLMDAPAAAADRPLPVVLLFHGFRSNAREMRAAGFRRGDRPDPMILVHADGHDGVRLLGKTGRGWDFRVGETRDIEFVRMMLDEIERDRCVDRRRIYATGMSNGGFFANLVGCALADRIAAVAPVAGALPLDGCAPSRPVAVLLIHGAHDRITKVEHARAARDWWAQTQGCGQARAEDECQRYADCRGAVVYCEGDHEHVWPNDATGRILNFFRAQSRAD
jgi:polyhydroxybutyrate depolymerase